MRPIDADALIEKYGDWYVEEGTKSGFIGTLKDLFATGPTIHPVATDINDGDLISRKMVLALRRNKVRSLHTYEVIEETINVTDIENLPYAQPDNQTNLCDSCDYSYPDCPSKNDDVIFGNGIGNDNICACNKYKPSAQPSSSCAHENDQDLQPTCNHLATDAVSRQDAIDAVEALAYHADKYVMDSDVHEVHGFRTGLAVAERQLSLVPSAQSEIIRCKDCKHFIRDISCVDGHYDGCDEWTDNGNEIMVAEDDFCSYAERRTDE